MGVEQPHENIKNNGDTYRAIREGKATILAPLGAQIGEEAGAVQTVFYNPIQQYNRDLSTLAIKTYGEQVIEERKQKLNARKSKQQNFKKRKREEKDDQERETVQDGSATLPLDENERQEPDTGEGLLDEPPIPFKILDALSASGLRALRYAKEIPFATSIQANDLSKSAATSIKLNVEYNGVADKVTVTNDDALAQMYGAVARDLSRRDKHGNPSKANKWDVIDLDPYGSAAPFFDAAVQAIRDDGGLLCVTCTDSAVWAGHCYSEKAFSQYGGTSVKAVFSHEYGLRLILNAISMSAARYGLAIEPQLSLSIDFYTKCFIKVTKSPQTVKHLGSKTMMLYNCDSGCTSFETQYLMRSQVTPNKSGSGVFYKHTMNQGPSSDRLCNFCSFKMHVAGPVYGGPIHNLDFVQSMLDQVSKADREVYSTLPRLEGMLSNVLDEFLSGPSPPENVTTKEAKAAAIDPYPFYCSPNRLASIVSTSAPPEHLFRGALVHLGYKVGRSHCKPGMVKTDAPWSTLWWIMTEWIRQKSPIKTANIKKLSPSWKILYDAGLVGHGEGNEPLPPPEERAADTTRSDEEAKQSPSNGANPGGNGGVSEKELELRKSLVFDDNLSSLGRDRKKQGMVRYQINPRENWGPLSRATKN